MLDGPFSIMVNCNGRVENYRSELHKRTSKLSIGVNHFGNDELHWRASKLSTVVSYSNNEKLQRCISKLSIVVSYSNNEKLQRCTNKLSTGKKKLRSLFISMKNTLLLALKAFGMTTVIPSRCDLFFPQQKKILLLKTSPQKSLLRMHNN